MKNGMKINKIGMKTLTIGFLLVMLCFTLFPVIYAFLASFKSNIELFTGSANILPKQWQWTNYVEAWKRAKFARYTINSVVYSTATTFLSVLHAAMVGYVWARGRFPGRKLMIALFISTMFISVGTLMLFPTLEVAIKLHISRSLWGLVLINGIGVNVAAYFLVSRYIASIPIELDEAAMVDGCSFFAVWWRMIFPLSRPVLATVGLLSFLGAWNDYLRPLIFTIGNTANFPLTVGIASLKGNAMTVTSYGLMLAGAAISLFPLIVMFILVNRSFIQGLTGGALKG